jgi:hypothetical protein
MLETSGESDLTKEALWTQDGGQLWVEHFERHRAVVLEILSEVNCGHAPTPKLAFDVVAVG